MKSYNIYDMSFYVYVLLDSSKPGKFSYSGYNFTYEPFYIGKGSGDRIKNTIYDKSPFKSNKIKKLKRYGKKIISLKIKEDLTLNEAYDLEIFLIKEIGRRDINNGTLVNLTDGGEGRLNSEHSEETKIKISKSKKGNSGWKHSEETLLKMSINQMGENNGFYGKTHSSIVKKNQSDKTIGYNHPMYGKTHSEETKKKIKESRSKVDNSKIKESCQQFNKEVLMFDLDLNFIKEFKSVKLASVETGINESIISKCCRGDIISPTRYFFKYSKEEDKIKNNKFLIEIGTKFKCGKVNYILVKRNKESCVCESEDGLVNISKKEFPHLFKKDTNNADITELYIFLKNIDNSFKLNGDTIYNKDRNIRYLKLINNCEIFKTRKEIYDTDDIIIFEDEWLNKKEIIKSRLRNILNFSNRIYARACEVREVTDNKLIRDFLITNHLQGFIGSKVKIGIFYKGELISLMTFGSLRKNLGQVSKEGSYELLRFCNKLNTSVVGGASKLFKYFINNYNPFYIISYADRRWSDGSLYLKLGFDFKYISDPSYFYIINNKREGRFNHRKDILVKKGFDPNMTEVEIQHSRGYFRIFDSGAMKFEYNNISSSSN